MHTWDTGVDTSTDTNMETHRQKQRGTDTDTDTDGQIDRQADRQKEPGLPPDEHGGREARTHRGRLTERQLWRQIHTRIKNRSLN